MEINKRDLKYASKCFEFIIKAKDKEFSEDINKRIMKNCGRACAHIEDTDI